MLRTIGQVLYGRSGRGDLGKAAQRGTRDPARAARQRRRCLRERDRLPGGRPQRPRGVACRDTGWSRYLGARDLEHRPLPLLTGLLRSEPLNHLITEPTRRGLLRASFVFAPGTSFLCGAHARLTWASSALQDRYLESAG